MGYEQNSKDFFSWRLLPDVGAAGTEIREYWRADAQNCSYSELSLISDFLQVVARPVSAVCPTTACIGN
jgi:hypothetical protein